MDSGGAFDTRYPDGEGQAQGHLEAEGGTRVPGVRPEEAWRAEALGVQAVMGGSVWFPGRLWRP